MTNISRSTMELLLVTLLLTASMAVVVDAPLDMDRHGDLGLPSGQALTPAGTGALPSTGEAHGDRPHFQQRHIARLEASASRKLWLIEMRRTHAADARYQVLRCEAARRPMEIQLVEALEQRGQPLATRAGSDERDKTIEELKLAVVAATKRLHRAQQVLNQIERSIARRTLRVLRLETQLDLTQQGVTTLMGRRAGSPLSAPGPRAPV